VVFRYRACHRDAAGALCNGDQAERMHRFRAVRLRDPRRKPDRLCSGGGLPLADTVDPRPFCRKGEKPYGPAGPADPAHPYETCKPRPKREK
jgi:hypothetical protein